MAYQVTRAVSDPADIAFAVRIFEECGRRGEAVQWFIRHEWRGQPPKLWYSLWRSDCHVEISTAAERHNEAVLVED